MERAPSPADEQAPDAQNPDVLSDAPTQVPVVKPLETVWTYINSSVIFHCEFLLPSKNFYSVEWTVGEFKCQRSNSLLRVIHKGGNFILYIPKLVPRMAGTITCQLLHSSPDHELSEINKTSARIIMIPRRVSARVINPSNLNVSQRASPYHVPTTSSEDAQVASTSQQSSQDWVTPQCSSWPDDWVSPDFVTVLPKTTESPIATMHPVLITYCWLGGNQFYLLATLNNIDVKQSVFVFEKCDDDLGESPDRDTAPLTNIIFHWIHCVNQSNCQFTVDILNDNGQYVPLGTTINPCFEVKGVCFEEILQFRIQSEQVTDESAPTPKININVDDYAKTPLLNLRFKPLSDFDNEFTMSNIVYGEGTFGKVSHVSRKSNGVSFAAKCIKMSTFKIAMTAKKEYLTLIYMSHPKLVKLEAVYLDKTSMVLVMEALSGGDLLERISEDASTSELHIMFYIQQICEGLRYMHKKRIVHLDIKPENIMCVHPNSWDVKIIDFGLSRILDINSDTTVVYGTRNYISPEILNGDPITVNSDMWSLGVLTYMLLSGHFPFIGESWVERKRNIVEANYDFSQNAFRAISELAKDFVRNCLTVDPYQRLTASSAMDHPWMVASNATPAMMLPLMLTRENIKAHLAVRERWKQFRIALRVSVEIRGEKRKRILEQQNNA